MVNSYELHKLPFSGYVYRLVPLDHRAAIHEYLCATCYEWHCKTILQPMEPVLGSQIWACHKCRSYCS
jgi:hypothetical protein